MILPASIVLNLYTSIIKKISELFVPLPTESSASKWKIRNSFLRLIGMEIEKNVAIHSGLMTISGLESNISIAEHTAIGYNLRAYSFNKISIGKFCMIANEVEITNGGHDTSSLKPYSSEINIGNGVWIGHGAVLVAKQNGLTIGNNAIIGAGSLVIADVPENAIAAGVPAKVIGYRELPEKVWHLGNIYFCPVTFTPIGNL